MSRVAKQPVSIPSGVEVSTSANQLRVKGKNGELSATLPDGIAFEIDGGQASVAGESLQKNRAMAGTARALLNNMVHGVSEGFQKKLELVGVGYRAQAQGRKLNLTLGFSHPVVYEAPDGITIETPSQTEVVVSGADKQVVGQVAADIRAYRPPEPYKGKGVRYSDERVVRKEAKKK